MKEMIMMSKQTYEIMLFALDAYEDLIKGLRTIELCSSKSGLDNKPLSPRFVPEITNILFDKKTGNITLAN